MKFSISFRNVLCFVFILFSQFIYSQENCCVEVEISGGSCFDCVPDDYDPIGTPNLSIDGSYGACELTVGSDSYTGGGYSAFAVFGGPTPSEGLIATGDGLIPGSSYVIGFEWQSTMTDCSGVIVGGTSDLVIEVEGNVEEYTYSGSGWDQIIFCFTPSSTDFEVSISGITSDFQAFIVVDYLPCDFILPMQTCTNCCDLETTINDDSEICAGDNFLFDANFENANGTVTFEWFCDPPEGLDYLDDVNSLTPTFNFPFSDEIEGECFEYTIEFMDDSCEETEEIKITLLPNVIPEFDPLIVCGYNTLLDLPTSSTNGYDGIFDWDEDDFSDYEGETILIDFLITQQQNNCLTSYPIEVTVLNFPTPEFSFELEYCINDDDFYDLPVESDNGIMGSWNPAEFSPERLAPGSFDYIFTVDQNTSCGLDLVISITIFESVDFVFNLPDSLCLSELPFVLPTTSDNQLEGEWDEPEIEANLFSNGEFTNVFNSIEESCTNEYVWTFYLTESVEPVFSIDTTLCEGFDFLTLSNISADGQTGTWSPDTLFENNFIGNSFTAVWMPDVDQSCTKDFSQIFYLEPNMVYDQDFLQVFCEGDDFTFPIVMDNSVTGTWEFDSLNLYQQTGSVENEFFADGIFCIDDTIISFEILPMLDPVFSFSQFYCFDESDFILPLLSDNNIEGTWNLGEIVIEDFIGEKINLTFTPNTLCDNNYNITVEVLDTINLQVISEPPTDCNQLDGTIDLLPNNSELEFSIDQGLTWSVSNNFRNLGFGNYSIEVRNVNLPDCISQYEVEFNNFELPDFTIEISPLTSCLMPNASLEILLQSSDIIEFSIDDKNNWTETLVFENLADGNYILWARLKDNPECENQTMFTIEAIEDIEIEYVEVIHNSNCILSNGSLQLTTVNDCQFSLDGIDNWQDNALFENLEGGDYEIFIRLSDYPDCVISIIETVNEIMLPEITDILLVTPMSCTSSDGSIQVISNSTDVEYSIDNGMTWQPESIFENLNAGTYNIAIQLMDSEDCIVESEIELSSPELPVFTIQEIINPTACQLDNGSILISSNSVGLEFSIDNGQMWQVGTLFENLKEGDFLILARFTNNIDCISQIEITLALESESIDNFEVSIINPSVCAFSDGGFTIDIDNPEDYVFSIDGGVNQISENIFSNLTAGEYTVQILSAITDLCSVTTIVELIDPVCPCSDYILEYTALPISCDLKVLGSIDVTLQSEESILWEDGQILSSIDDLEEGWYSFEIEYGDQNCVYSDSIYIGAVDPLEFALQSFPSDCEEVPTGSIEVVNVEGGSGDYNYSIGGIDYQESSQFYNLSPDAYQVYVEEMGGCVAFSDIIVGVNDAPGLSLPSIVTIEEGESLFLNPLINETSIDSFQWILNDELLENVGLVVETSPVEDQFYTLIVFFGECTEERTIQILINRFDDIYLPNVININASNNNVFYAQSNSSSNISIESYSIYDRWGNLVFSKLNPIINERADGFGLSSFRNLIDGVYIYKINLTINGRSEVRFGDITVLR